MERLGGRGGSTPATTRVAKAPSAKAKYGPSRLVEMDFVKDPSLEGSFTVVLGSDTGLQQWTFHHPVGETGLDARSWVATLTNEIEHLLKRKVSEELSAWLRKSALAKREAVLMAGTGRKYFSENDQTEVWSFEDSPAIGPTIKESQKAAKADGKLESEWLKFAPPAVQVAETAFKEALKKQSIPETWLGVNPKPEYETRGGPLGDRPQQNVEYLGTDSHATAKDHVLRRMLGLQDPSTSTRKGKETAKPEAT